MVKVISALVLAGVVALVAMQGFQLHLQMQEPPEVVQASSATSDDILTRGYQYIDDFHFNITGGETRVYTPADDYSTDAFRGWAIDYYVTADCSLGTWSNGETRRSVKVLSGMSRTIPRAAFDTLYVEALTGTDIEIIGTIFGWYDK
jgi:hypothetical protein